MTTTPELILASASPRRADLLRQIGVAFRVAPVSICEDRQPGEAPSDYVSRLALAKAREGFQESDRPDLVVLGADTTVVYRGQIMGKPANKIEAVNMLQKLAGSQHEVYSAVALTNGSKEQLRVSKTLVRFRPIEQWEIDAYWDSGEPRDKAGSYAIQGLGAVFVRHISGSYSGVVGLPLQETCELLQLFAVPVWQKGGEFK